MSNKKYRKYDGAVIAIPLILIRELGLNTAAFLQQASFLSNLKSNSKYPGWFDLPAEGEPDPQSKDIFSQLGSWDAGLGIKRGSLKTIRKKLKDLDLLDEKLKGVPARLFYRVKPCEYNFFLKKLEDKKLDKTTTSSTKSNLQDFKNIQSSSQVIQKQECGLSANYSRDTENKEIYINKNNNKNHEDSWISRGAQRYEN